MTTIYFSSHPWNHAPLPGLHMHLSYAYMNMCNYALSYTYGYKVFRPGERNLDEARTAKAMAIVSCWVVLSNHTLLSCKSAVELMRQGIAYIHRVSKKTSTHIIGYKLRNSCPILIIFDTKIPHII